MKIDYVFNSVYSLFLRGQREIHNPLPLNRMRITMAGRDAHDITARIGKVKEGGSGYSTAASRGWMSTRMPSTQVLNSSV